MMDLKSPNICLHYILAVDLGQAIQPTAMAVIEQQTERTTGWGADTTALRLRHLERLTLDAGYPKLIERIRSLLGELDKQDQAGKSDLVLDITGTGRAVGELIRQRGLEPYTVTITAGSGEMQSPDDIRDWRVAKVDLIGGLQVAYQMQRLKVARDLNLVPTLLEELQTFKLRPPTLNPSDPESWREGQHDDLVFAVALGVWRAAHDIPQPISVRDHWDKRLSEGYKKMAKAIV